jgi:hypothetical protein
MGASPSTPPRRRSSGRTIALTGAGGLGFLGCGRLLTGDWLWESSFDGLLGVVALVVLIYLIICATADNAYPYFRRPDGTSFGFRRLDEPDDDEES